LAARGERAEAIKSYQAAIVQQKDPAAARYLRGVLRTVQWELDFYAFKEVKLNADADLGGFRPVFGKWIADTDGALIATAEQEQQVYVYCNADFGNNWELHADIDFLRTDADWSLTGLTLCPSGTNKYLSLGLCPRQHKFIAHISNMDELESHPAPVVWRNHDTTLRRDGDQITFKLGDTVVYNGPCDDTETNRLRIGFGGWPIPENDAVRFRNITIKRTR
jgi:hypothetical protein